MRQEPRHEAHAPSEAQGLLRGKRTRNTHHISLPQAAPDLLVGRNYFAAGEPATIDLGNENITELDVECTMFAEKVLSSPDQRATSRTGIVSHTISGYPAPRKQ